MDMVVVDTAAAAVEVRCVTVYFIIVDFIVTNQLDWQ